VHNRYSTCQAFRNLPGSELCSTALPVFVKPQSETEPNQAQQHLSRSIHGKTTPSIPPERQRQHHYPDTQRLHNTVIQFLWDCTTNKLLLDCLALVNAWFGNIVMQLGELRVWKVWGRGVVPHAEGMTPHERPNKGRQKPNTVKGPLAKTKKAQRRKQKQPEVASRTAATGGRPGKHVDSFHNIYLPQHHGS